MGQREERVREGRVREVEVRRGVEPSGAGLCVVGNFHWVQICEQDGSQQSDCPPNGCCRE